MTEIRTIKISGREFQVEGTSPRFGTYVLTGSRGAAYIAVPAYTDAPGIFKVLGGRYSVTELRIAGNLVRLTDRDGELREATRADIMAAVKGSDYTVRLTPEQVAANALERREITRLRSSSGEPWNRPLSSRTDC